MLQKTRFFMQSILLSVTPHKKPVDFYLNYNSAHIFIGYNFLLK